MVLKIEFTKEFENKFRELAMKKFGYAKGAIKKAGEEAMKEWIKLEENNIPKLNDPIESISGMMKHLKGKITSVELQHEASKLWIK